MQFKGGVPWGSMWSLLVYRKRTILKVYDEINCRIVVKTTYKVNQWHCFGSHKKQLLILENIFKLSKVSRLLSLERLKGEEGWLLPGQGAVVRPPPEYPAYAHGILLFCCGTVWKLTLVARSSNFLPTVVYPDWFSFTWPPGRITLVTKSNTIKKFYIRNETVGIFEEIEVGTIALPFSPIKFDNVNRAMKANFWSAN